MSTLAAGRRQPGDQVRVAADPADAQAAPERLGRRPDRDDERRPRPVAGERRRRRSVHRQLGHDLVADDGRAVPAGQRAHRGALVVVERRARRVAVVGDQVDEPRARPAGWSTRAGRCRARARRTARAPGVRRRRGRRRSRAGTWGARRRRGRPGRRARGRAGGWPAGRPWSRGSGPASSACRGGVYQSAIASRSTGQPERRVAGAREVAGEAVEGGQVAAVQDRRRRRRGHREVDDARSVVVRLARTRARAPSPLGSVVTVPGAATADEVALVAQQAVGGRRGGPGHAGRVGQLALARQAGAQRHGARQDRGPQGVGQRDVGGAGPLPGAEDGAQPVAADPAVGRESRSWSHDDRSGYGWEGHSRTMLGDHEHVAIDTSGASPGGGDSWAP